MTFQTAVLPPSILWHPVGWFWWWILEIFWFFFFLFLVFTILFGCTYFFFPKQTWTWIVIVWFAFVYLLQAVWWGITIPILVSYNIACFLAARLWNRVFTR
jgi:hypothetical protein